MATTKTPIIHDEVLGMDQSARSHEVGKVAWKTQFNMRVDRNRLTQVNRKGSLATLGTSSLSCPLGMLTEAGEQILTEAGEPIYLE